MDTLFFIASKLVGALLRADTWIVIALAGIILALILQRRRMALYISSIALGFLIALSILPLGDLLLQPIERLYPANPDLDAVDGIIVLGGGEDARASAFWDQVQFNDGAERYTAALALARRFPEAHVLFTGGSGALRDAVGADTSEASIAERFFLAQGIATGRLLLESQSRNTTENARLSLTLADPVPEETWVLVTSAFHMPRAMRSFEAAGWKGLVAWPVDYRTAGFGDRIGWGLTQNLTVLNTAIREHVGQLAYHLSGR
ncbi:YdcF family protein [Sulfitobacter sp. M22]|uniref:YdcF family protein n=1 Tax=Sulfitobacter sp. M22 TaxID=2675332 RepID=UPI001F31FAB3|nr:YdcF family protein [Sulfitobacter sp. M22]MCF7728050.1 YdcF family protein [Sulfitobacter sp. M22]